MLFEVLTFLLLQAGLLAVSATACEGVGGPELTTLSTSLSGEGKEGTTITVLEGSKVKDKATLKGKNASTATGKVIYKVYSDSECKTLVATAGEVTISGESVPASNEEALEAGRAYYWQAHYTGDSKNAESTSECNEISDIKAKTSLSTELSGESKEAEELTVLEGAKAKDIATLSGTNFSTASGQAVYDVYSDDKCEHLVTAAGEVVVSAGKIPASSEETLEGGKIYYWRATYQGDGLHQESKSPCGEDVLIVASCTFPYCKPTITPGVSLAIPRGAGETACTAGPILTKGTELFLLTAGHCLAKGLQKEEEEKFTKRSIASEYPKPVGQKSIGEKGEFKYTKKYDTAEIKVDNMEWLLPAGGVPAVLVEWFEPRPIVTSVIGEVPSKVGDLTCHTGITARVQCGRILRIGEPPLLAGYQILTKEEIVETTAKSEEGDSGGPVFEPSEFGARIQGTEVAGGKWDDGGQGNLTNKTPLITEFPGGTAVCGDIKKMKALWPVPVEAEKGVPDGTTVTSCTVTGTVATIGMSNDATETIKDLWITIGHLTLSWYEPMTRILAAYPGQALLAK